MKKIWPKVLRGVISAVVIFLIYWFYLPPLNIFSKDFWTFLFFCLLVVILVNFTSGLMSFFRTARSGENVKFKPSVAAMRKSMGVPAMIIVISLVTMVVFSLIFNVIGAEIFNAKAYHDLITIENGDFAADVAELEMSQIPVVDREASVALGKRKLGEMSDLVSQFEIADDYTQINYQGKPVRVTPLRYGDPFKWLNNQSEGIPGYLRVDMTTQEVELVQDGPKIRYSESEYFLRDITRHLRFQYPTKIFADVSFEIDENGDPYWVASTVEFEIGFWSGRDISGVVLVNASTGESQYYDVEDVPEWIDQVYDSDLIIRQLTYNGKYRSGFWNSIFGQKGVIAPTDGYNYIALDDDVWLYTGMTSVVSDESNVGFVLVNMRTKETRYYTVAGAEEYSAMESAQGQVQHLGYSATFPLLLNVADRPTYFMSLKDAAGLVKMFAFVDVQQYQIVGTGSSVELARQDYLEKLKNDANITTPEPEEEETDTVLATVEDISTAVVDGNSMYYMKLAVDGETKIVTASIELSSALPFIRKGDALSLVYTKDGTLLNVLIREIEEVEDEEQGEPEIDPNIPVM